MNDAETMVPKLIIPKRWSRNNHLPKLNLLPNVKEHRLARESAIKVLQSGQISVDAP